LDYGIKKHGDINFIISDEMHFDTEFNIEISQEVLLANFASMKMTQSGQDSPYRKKPIFATIDILPEEYEDFWDYIDLKTEKWLDFFNNEIFGSGVPLPYWKLSFLSLITFHPRAMLVVVSIFYNH